MHGNENGSRGSLNALQGWTKLYGLEGATGDLFGDKSGSCTHAALSRYPLRYSGLAHPKALSRFRLAPEVVNQSLDRGFHSRPSDKQTYILEKKEPYLQGHKCTYRFSDMNLAQRMKAARKHAGLTQRQLADAVKVEQPLISQLETGKTLKSAHIAQIAKACRVSAIWLASGEGEMVPPLLTDDGKINLNKPWEDIYELSAESSNVLPAIQPTRLYRYPVVSEVQAGAWTEAVQPYAPGAEDHFELTDYKAKGPAFWLEVTGDSMTSPTRPSIPEGHFILVDTGLAPQPGDLVVAKLDTEEKATFKKLVSDAGQLYLKPLNPAYRMIPIDGNCRLIGVVKEAKMKL